MHMHNFLLQQALQPVYQEEVKQPALGFIFQ